MKRPPKETPALYAQDGRGYDATVHAHYFVASCDWLITEYDPAQDLAFGWACLGGDRQNAELGYVDLDGLAELRIDVAAHIGGERRVLPAAMRVELDEHWRPCSITDAIELLDRRAGGAL